MYQSIWIYDYKKKITAFQRIHFGLFINDIRNGNITRFLDLATSATLGKTYKSISFKIIFKENSFLKTSSR